MGPMTLDFAGFVGLRLNEHALHTWDIEVTLDPHAPVAQDATRLVVDNLQMITRFTGKPIGTERDITVHTTEPQRDFTITVRADAVSLEPTEGVDEPDLDIPAEAFVRLVYGRMDPDHTPPTRGPADLDELRRMFPGPLIVGVMDPQRSLSQNLRRDRIVDLRQGSQGDRERHRGSGPDCTGGDRKG